ncbi:MAG: aspartyl/asparaginyl beta-hydroxylase domain-containing protein, partial [Scytonema sp. RU_4_4]|nr:aspartyl/asparaginyl beta-hydroxylase domain-containing protein [Scytonema sp. RU_4_4]
MNVKLLFSCSSKTEFFSHLEEYIKRYSSDATNTYIGCHLGLIIPENCGFKVGSETRSWTEGK